MSGQCNRPLRVCFVIENLIPAGTELWILRLIERLDRARVQPLLCVIDGNSRSSKQLEPSDCPTIRLGLSSLRTVNAFSAASRFYRFLRHHHVDVVQVHHADPAYLGVPVARLARVPKVLQTKYDVGYWLKGADLWMHRFLRRWVDETIANCEACRQASIAQEWSPEEKVQVLDNGIELDRLTRIPPIQFEDRQHVRVGMLANLRPVKDAETFVRAAHRLSAERPHLSFHLIGDGEQRASLEQLASELGVVDHVVFHGHVAEPSQLIGEMSIGVLCSLSEGLPHALLEFMAAGRPVVATQVGGNAEIVDDGHTGRLVPAGDPEALANAIAQMLDTPLATKRMGIAAQKNVAERFALDAMTRRFEAFYERIFDQRAVKAPLV